MPRRFAVTRALVYAHRWLGIGGGALFTLWFASGVVMMYARMPALEPAERLHRLEPLDLSGARIAPAQAAAEAGLAPERVRIGMLGDRPVYRFATGARWRTVFADDGQPLAGLTAGEALDLAARFMPECRAAIELDARLLDADQWTLQSRGFLPLHRIACGDANASRLYVSDRTGEVVMTTDRDSRRWGYLGAVLHWLYFTPLRRHGALWLHAMTWLSIGGCLLAASGLLLGILRFSPGKQHRPHGAPARSPYTGLLRWHHYAGLIFGLATFGFILSGCLSLDPWGWHAGTAPTPQQREAFAGGALRLDQLDLGRLHAAVAAISSSFAPKELEVLQFRGETLLLAYRAGRADAEGSFEATEPSSFLAPVLPLEHRLVSMLEPGRPAPAPFSTEALLKAARAAMPGAGIESAERLERYDAYYYERAGALPLPVLRVRYDDPAATWLYLDPQRGLILRREQRSSRVNRWLYRGLHRFDFPWLYQRRPLWDIVVILLLLGGLLQSATAMVPAMGRLARHLRGLT